MDEALLRKARVAAARDGKGLSRFVAETVGRRVASARHQGCHASLAEDMTHGASQAPTLIDPFRPSPDEFYQRT